MLFIKNMKYLGHGKIIVITGYTDISKHEKIDWLGFFREDIAGEQFTILLSIVHI